MPNALCYFELITADIKRSAAFYTDVFGWQVTPTGKDYAMFDTGAEPSGGFSPPMPGIANGVCIYVSVDDIDAALEKVARNGGELVLGKTKIGDEYGYYALFRDPTGNVIGLWSRS